MIEDDNINTAPKDNNDLNQATEGFASAGTQRPHAQDYIQRKNANQGHASGSTQRPTGSPRISLRPGGTVKLRSGVSISDNEGSPSTRVAEATPTHRPQVSNRIGPAISQRALSTTSRPHGPTPAYHVAVTDEVFTFEGKQYKRESLISSTTGEAEIFLVSLDGERYVLKLYYKGYYPSAEVLEILKGNIGNGYVVDVITYGAWTSQAGEERFGVLMHYYSGGVLKGGEFRGKAKALEKIAIEAMDAINFCHEHGIMHKDVKPNNFIYANESRQHIVLADFGIASTFTRDLQGKVIPFVNVNQNRTYIYASPEIFNLTVQRPDGKVEVEYSDIKSDFFALGMTLLVLWMGEAPFALLDELSLLKLKRGERSGLPYPEDIPHHMRNLIKGLTIADPQKRWGFEEFQRWVRGEDVDVELTNPRDSRSMRIVYNGSKHQVATSVRQLAEFMLADPVLGEQYLYSGKISRWMTETGHPEWQMRIDSIVNKQYPRSRRSGLLAACYKMNPDLPFVGVTGNKCYNNVQIARELTRNADQYSAALRDHDAPLYIYFNAHGIDTGTKYQAMFKSNPWLAIWRLAYAISSECEFPFWSTTRNAIVWCSTIDELIEEYASSSQDRYASFNVRTPIGRYTPMLLTDECFVTWLAARQPEKAERIKTALTKEKSHGTDLYAYIFYLLDPDRNFFYETDNTYYYTLGHIGALINQDLIDYLVIGRHDNNQYFYNEQHRRSEQLAHYHDTKLYYYIKSRKDANITGNAVNPDNVFEFIDKCFDLHSKENRLKAGPYTSKLATLKICHQWAGGSFYYFPTSRITVSHINEIKDVPPTELQEELHHGFLLEWLAVQYQENPNINIDDDQYNHLLLQFMDKVESIDPNYNEVIKFKKCCGQVERNAQDLRKGISRNVRLKTVLVAFAAIVALMIVGMLLGGTHSLPTNDEFSYNWRTMAYIAAPLFVVMMTPPVQSFVNDLTKGFLGSPLLFAFVISNVIVLGWEAMRLYIMPYSYISLPIIYGIVGACILFSCFYKRGLRQRRYASCIHPDFNTSYVEPLAFTWDDSADPYREFDSSVVQQTKEYASYLKRIHVKLKSSVRFYSVWLLVLIVGFCFASLPVSAFMADVFPWIEHKETHPGIQQYDNADAVQLYICDVEQSLSVRKSPDHKSPTVGTLNDKDLVEVVGFDGDYARILFDGDVAYVLKKFIKPLE